MGPARDQDGRSSRSSPQAKADSVIDRLRDDLKTTGRPDDESPAPPAGGRLIGLAASVACASCWRRLAVGMVVRTRPVRESVRRLHRADRRRQPPGPRGRRARSARRATSQAHAPEPAREGGIVGLPRNIHKNFQAWRHGPHVWICPTNRVGPVYQFVREAGAWRFDGPVGILRGRGEVILMEPEAIPLEDADDPEGHERAVR